MRTVVSMFPIACLGAQGEGMRDVEMLVWAGDFNYRVDVSYADALSRIKAGQLDDLLHKVCLGFEVRIRLQLPGGRELRGRFVAHQGRPAGRPAAQGAWDH